jgi:Asp-tRNA(Asn)/Glu-tRNA(Gln) amidotransferase A subunit family amidase
MQVAIGEVDMAIGTDQGGSVRLPSCWCGIVGLKPTYGLVPYTGILAMEAQLDHCGPMARTVHDCALLLEVRIHLVPFIVSFLHMHILFMVESGGNKRLSAWLRQ